MKFFLLFFFSLTLAQYAHAKTGYYNCLSNTQSAPPFQLQIHYAGAIHVLSPSHGYCGAQMLVASSQGKILEMYGNLGGPQCRKAAEIRWKDEYGILPIPSRIVKMTSTTQSALFDCLRIKYE